MNSECCSFKVSIYALQNCDEYSSEFNVCVIVYVTNTYELCQLKTELTKSGIVVGDVHQPSMLLRAVNKVLLFV